MTTATDKGQLIGYARVSTQAQSLDAQTDALAAVGVDPERVYSDKLSGTRRRSERPGLAALLDYARPGDVIVVVGFDRLGRDVAEVMATVNDLTERGIVIRSLREGIDSTTPIGRAIVGVFASMAQLELEFGRERRAAAREARRARDQPIGRPRALSSAKLDQVLKLHAAGESVVAIAKTFDVGRDTIYRAIRDAEQGES
jgi:DNA invertase Pin-like site-specific DNA recombinase